jgi:outer membrane lipoprotein SlyB
LVDASKSARKKAGRTMKTLRGITLVLLLAVTPSCVTTSTEARVWSAPQIWVRPGHVRSIREVIVRQQGNPVGGALAGAVIGGLIGGHGAAGLIGAAGGAAVGAAVSQGSEENRRYEVLVQFDDGGYQTFVYGGYSPFQPGQPVVLRSEGLAPGS